MKRFFLIVVFLVSVFLNTSNLVFAQSNAQYQYYQQHPEMKIPFAVPGLNCGYAGIDGKDGCCVSVNPEVDSTNPFMTFFNHIPLVMAINFMRDSISTQRNKLGIIDRICQSGVPSENDPSSPSCRCINAITPSPAYLGALNSFCQSQSNLGERNSCLQCANSGGVWSGVGCVKTDFKGFIEETVFGIGVGLAGGFSLLCVIYAAFMMQSSQGNPEKLKKAQEMITSCIIGLMLVIFSVFILKLIGVNILRIPGFGN